MPRLEIVWRNPNPPKARGVKAMRRLIDPDQWFAFLYKDGTAEPAELRPFEVVNSGRYSFYRPKRRVMP